MTSQQHKAYKYNTKEAPLVANFVSKYSLSQQYALEKDLKLFGQCGHDAIKKEIGQLHDQECFEPISINNMTTVEQRKAQVALSLLTEKQTGKVKGRTVYNGKPTQA